VSNQRSAKRESEEVPQEEKVGKKGRERTKKQKKSELTTADVTIKRAVHRIKIAKIPVGRLVTGLAAAYSLNLNPLA